MAIKMVVTDLDRTLLKDDKTISTYTAETLEELRRKGIPFVVATARPERAVKNLLTFLKYDAAIFYNGAAVIAGDKALGESTIPNAGKIVEEILCARPESKISVESGGKLFSNLTEEELGAWKEFGWQGLDELGGAEAHKILITGQSLEEMQGYQQYIPDELYMELCENTLIMVMNRQATKLNGIRLLAEHYGIGLDEVAAFGDDYNDIEMLSACGAGVAVDNALPEVKAAADTVCASNEQDGVARWIRENVLISIAK